MLNKAKGWQGETFRQIGQDDPLGSVAIPITMTPSELKNLRFQLDRVASDPEKIYEFYAELVEGPVLPEKDAHKVGSCFKHVNKVANGSIYLSHMVQDFDQTVLP